MSEHDSCEHVWDQRGKGWFCVVCHLFTLSLPPTGDITATARSFRLLTQKHGAGCSKIVHDNRGGYLHGPDDDAPYDVDGMSYCGRCHEAIG